jgi:general secretion pathway protein G
MKRKGFTLVEILIVVIILGILAAIVIPQFSEASDDARLSSLVSDLQTLRSQLELYRVQHNSYPNGATSAAWKAQLTGQTDIDGAAGTDYGPYLQTFPTNPFNDSNDVYLDADGSGSPGAQSTGLGWYFRPSDGKFAPNDDATHGAL